MTLRVGILCPYSLRWPGGVQNHVLGLARALGGEGVDAEILAPTDMAPAPATDVEVVSLGVSVPLPANGSVARIGLDPVASVRAALSARRFDVVHVHEPLVPGVALSAVLAAKGPVVGTFHAASEGYWGYRWGRRLLRPAWDRLAARLAVSEAAVARVAPYFVGDVEVVPNGVDTARFADGTPLVERDLDEGPVVLFLGRDEPRKGLDVLVAAWAAVRERVPGAALWVAGPGTEGVQALGVRAFGEVEDEFVPALYASADVFCAPARGGESFGVVLAEAMAAGLAVVATDIPGYAAVARPDAEAVLVPPDSPEALAGALAGVLGDSALRERLAAAGRSRAAEFDWSVVAGRVLGVYERVTA